MSETAKSGLFVGVALLLVVTAWASRPQEYSVDLSEQVGQLLSEGDPLEATSLEIVKFDEDTGETKPFKVAEIGGVWSLPSHSNYPADAENQLADVAAALLGLEVLNVFDIQPDDYAEYGVVDPANAKAGDTGVGMRVTLETADGSKLTDLVIGKQDPDQSANHFVRLPNQDVVYVVPLDTSKLTTRFQDWIEDDLLKLNAFDIKQVVLNNYSFDEVNGQIVEGDIVDLTYNDEESKWVLSDLEEGEELDDSKLNEMKQALDDLKIIDVRRKPEGLSRELRSEEGIRLNQQAMIDLAQHGFYLTREGQLISNEGEVVVLMKDGVEYMLRFGEIARTDEEEGDGEPAEGEENDAAAGADGPSTQGSSRYIFVMARFNPDLIEKPELEALPEEAGPETEDSAGDDENGDDPAGAESEQADDSADGEAAGDAEEADTEADAEEPDPEQQKREAIERENKRKQDEYNEKIEKGKERVKELNDRFADWYYIISDDVYQKIHLSRDDVLKAPEEPEGESGESDTSLEAFEEIKEEGLETGAN